MQRTLLITTGFLFFFMTPTVRSKVPQQTSVFTVQDDIELTHFGHVEVSPNHKMVVVQTERPSLQDGLVYETLRVFNFQDIHCFINGLNRTSKVEPVWSFERATTSGGDSDRISAIKWMADGSGFAFSLQVDPYHRRLYLASVGARTVIPLSAERDDVLGFAVRDSSHYVFTVASHETLAKLQHMLDAPFRVGTGDYYHEVAFPEAYSHIIQRGELWAAVGGAPTPVKDRSSGNPIILYSDGSGFLSLSPDGETIVTIRAVEKIPPDWETRFPPPYPNSAYGLKAHHQDLSAALDGWMYVGEWVRISLADGTMTSLTNAPATIRAGWWEAYAAPAWSDDGSMVLLPGTFGVDSNGNDERPCVAVAQIAKDHIECIKRLKRNLANGFESGYMPISDVSFVHGHDDVVLLKGYPSDKGDIPTGVYVRSAEGEWHSDQKHADFEQEVPLKVEVRETFKEPPRLIATDPTTKRTVTLLDPNPQLKNKLLGEAEPYSWQNDSGRSWNGILYKPVGYQPHGKYPLVIQNHGFSMNHFVPSGAYPTAFVAQELAAAGIEVLQVRDCDGRSTQSEGPCNVEEYEAAIRALSANGDIDPTRIGIIGFSRTVFYVLEALTTSKVRFKAASITDGVTFGYMNYLLSVGPNRTYQNEQVSVIGAEPFGPGLAEWVKSSPGFNLDKVTTPLRVVAMRGSGVVAMWEPYALLEAMHKPVDLIVLNTHEHVLRDPVVRLAAQGGNVDWFRFWLQGYERLNPEDLDQYKRWEHLRELHQADLARTTGVTETDTH